MAKVYSVQLEENLGVSWCGTLTEAKRLRHRLLSDGEIAGEITEHDAVTIIEKQDARIETLETALRQAQSLLRSSQSNWNEQAYFDADTVIANALK